MEKLLQAHHLGHAFDYPLFDDISLELHSQESIAVLGVSGSGKSTLLHILSTLLPPQKGRVELFGQDIYAINEEERLKIRRYKVGIIFQSHYLFKGFSALENIEVAALLAKTSIDPELLEAFGIERVLHKRVTQLSGGEQQRISIARVMTKKPQIIFADEPTGNLDRETAYEVMGEIFRFIDKKKGGLFLVTHDEKLAEKCSRRFLLEDRQLKPLE